MSLRETSFIHIMREMKARNSCILETEKAILREQVSHSHFKEKPTQNMNPIVQPVTVSNLNIKINIPFRIAINP